MKSKPIDHRLTLRLGNIVAQADCDAVVNSANSNLRLGSGVSGAIHTAAGPDLESYCIPLRPLRLGQAIVTPGFRLPNAWVIHVKVPHYLNDDDPETAMSRAVSAVLITAEAHRFKRIAIPALGTGKFMFPPQVAAPIMVDAIRSHLTRSAMDEVRIVLPGLALMQCFETVVRHGPS